MFGYRNLGFGAFPNRAAAGASPTIESIRESRVFTWDASISTTSQTVANQESSPADGSSQTTYDVRRGTSTSSDSRDPNYDSGSQYYNQGHQGRGTGPGNQGQGRGRLTYQILNSSKFS